MPTAEHLAHVVVGYTVAVAPVLGRWRYQRLLKKLRAADVHARVAFYQHTILIKVVLAGAVLVWMGTAVDAEPFQYSHASAMITGPSLLVLLVGMAGSIAYYRRRGNNRLRRILNTAGGVLPRTRAERSWFSLFCAVVGVSEELVHRWLWISYLLLYLPHVGYWVSGVVAAVVFGLGHFYQGWRGIVETSLIGFALLLIWVGTGSLWVAIVAHIAMNLRLALVLTPGRIEQIERARSRSG